LAETNRLPFDLPECEQELVGGFHTEYSGIKFVLFFLAEYTHIVTVSFLTVLLFFGGWHLPGLPGPSGASLPVLLLGTLVLVLKVSVVVGFIMLLRWALPRFRFDQLMALAWKGLIPLGLVNLLGVAIVLTFGFPKHWLIATALVPLLAAYYSAAQFNASVASAGRRSVLSNKQAVMYE
jgi:NADH-quinone oxidoreductase subunit H